MSVRNSGFVLLFSAVLLPFNVALASGIQNSGFENNLANWEILSQSDAVTVTGTEGEADSATYAEMGITVEPYIGEKMLRLGAPKQLSEKQKRGDNTVSQQYESTQDNLVFSFRLFSWEHRGDDVFRFDVKDAAGKHFSLSSPLTITFPRGPSQTCDTTPCEFTLNVGKRGDLLDTGWTEVKVIGLPVDGSPITVEYSVIGGQNEAHASWAYFDNANTPPVAKFSFTPNPPQEGEQIIFSDESYDPDPGDRIVQWQWELTDPVYGEQVFVSSESGDFSYMFPDEGRYIISLTVTDSYGASNTVATNQLTTDQVLIPELVVENMPVMASAMNYEVLAGSTIELISRFADGGFTDTHSASWSFPGVGSATINEERIPFMATGVASASFTAPDAPENQTGSVVIDDGDGGAVSIGVQLKVVGNNFDRREPNNTLESAPALPSGWSYLSNIESPNDVDIFEIVQPDGSPLPAGSEILLKLSNLPADFDMVVLTQLNVDPELLTTPVGFNWLRTPAGFNWLRTPAGFNWLRTPVGFNWLRTPAGFNWLRTPAGFNWLRTPAGFNWLRTPITFDQLPLSELAFTPPDGGDISGMDVSLAELGLGDLAQSGVSIVGYSANRGFEDEAILVRKDYADAKMYVAVIGNNGSFNPVPYSLQIETSRQLDLPALLGDKCNGSPVVTSGATTTVQTLIDTGADAKSLFVTQKERIQNLYGMQGDDWNVLRTSLSNLSKHPAVKGTVISLPSEIYDVWDMNPCSIEEANRVADAIRGEIQTILKANPGIEYVVFLGGDNIAPYRRVPDATVISNERLYASDSFLEPGTPLHASIVTGNNLTDDFYVDNDPRVSQSGMLYVPKLSVARMVETPEEIAGLADAFVANNGVISLETALVTGYDFFVDSSKATDGYLSSSGVQTTTLISDGVAPDWTADDLRCQLLGKGASGCKVHNVNNINAHFAHYMAQSASGFNNIDGDILLSSEVALANNGVPVLDDTLVFSNGCHAGLSVPDGSAAQNTLGLGIDPNLDFSQSMARQRAVYVGNTGFGLGADTAIAGTERLMTLFAQEMLSEATVGKALLNAKQRYLNELGAISVYDEKSSIEMVLYGLPMYAFAGTGAGSMAGQETAAVVGAPYDNLSLTIDDGGVVNTNMYTIEKVDEEEGSFFTIAGGHQAVDSRAIQPKLVQDVSNGGRVHGVLLTAASFINHGNFDPVIARLTQEWVQGSGEGSACLNAFWPGELASPSFIRSGGALEQKLIIVPGQFRCDSGDNAIVTGMERLYTSLSLKVLRSEINDFQPPRVSELDIQRAQNGDAIVTVHASDDQSGVAEIVLLVIDPGVSNSGGVISSISSGPLSGEGPYSLPINGFADKKLIAQVVDGAGNIATWAGKGANIQGIEVDAGPDRMFSTSTPTSLTATVIGFTDYLAEGRDFSYVWNFGDGNLLPGTLSKNGQPLPDVVIDNDGNATFTVNHQYEIADSVVASVKVTDGFGGVGNDHVNMVFCGDAADVTGVDPDLDYTGCDMMNSSPTAVSLYLTVDGAISDTAQYRVYLDIQTKPHVDVPDGKSDIMLKYQGGSYTGLQSLRVQQVDAKTLRFDFDLADVKWKGSYFDWYAETQDGVAGAPTAGFIDVMPDEGMFRYLMQ